MGEQTDIAWADDTFNPWIGCAKVSAECRNCYAEAWAARYRHKDRLWSGNRSRTTDANWTLPRRWDRAAARAGERRRVFCASMADVFEPVPELEPWRDDLWRLIDATPRLDWLLLTKRPENIADMIPPTWWTCGCGVRADGSDECPNPDCGACPYDVRAVVPDNVWLGTTVGHQDTIGRAEELLNVDARVRFLSCEPLLGPLDLRSVLDGIHWVIVGGESGANARRMHPDWVRSIRDQCDQAGVPFFLKQWGGYHPRGEALLDDVVHLEFPTPTNVLAEEREEHT